MQAFAEMGVPVEYGLAPRFPRQPSSTWKNRYVHSLTDELTGRLRAAAGVDPELRPATKPEFGHFQSNVALRLAKDRGASPRQVAAELVESLDIDDLCLPVEIAGPGFLNLRLRPDVLARAVNEMAADKALGITPLEPQQTAIVDYSSPNVAKQMHVGHLRTTIIGDCFVRVLRAVGTTVIPQNHMGDWGRQFGMLIEQIADENLDLDTLDLPGAEGLYLRANAHLDADPEFAERARARVVALQAGDEETKNVWRRLIEISLTGFNTTYQRLGVLLTDDDIAGESSYNDLLGPIADDLEARGIAVHDQGALVVFVDGFDAPAIIRNSAGGYGYDVTDVAALKHRVDKLHADRLIYVTDARQRGHFELIFGVCRRAGYLPDDVTVQHVGYGMVTGADGRPFKTREGTAAHLDDLLDDAERVASPAIALAAIKYADLSNQLQKDYVFDADRMTKTFGDTGPYLQYAHARTAQILARAEAENLTWGGVETITEPAEVDLALALTGFSAVVTEVATQLTPHKLCIYLFDLATKYSVFYEQCPVVSSEDATRASRLALCAATKDVLARGLGLLGIEAPDRM